MLLEKATLELDELEGRHIVAGECVLECVCQLTLALKRCTHAKMHTPASVVLDRGRLFGPDPWEQVQKQTIFF
jgi:hypothetical protein